MCVSTSSVAWIWRHGQHRRSAYHTAPLEQGLQAFTLTAYAASIFAKVKFAAEQKCFDRVRYGRSIRPSPDESRRDSRASMGNQ